MALTKFRLVGHEQLSGLFYRGSFIAFERIDDLLAEQLIGKTHVLERLPASAPVSQLVLAEPAAKEASVRRRRANR